MPVEGTELIADKVRVGEFTLASGKLASYIAEGISTSWSYCVLNIGTPATHLSWQSE